MENLNYVFFEKFKHLDKLCCEMYNTNRGISNYIDDMKDVPYNDYRYIENWKTDLDKLIKLRHIRNNLAHTEGAFYETNCTQIDIDWIQNFYERILHQSDPIAMLYKYYREKNKMSKANNNKSVDNTISNTYNKSVEKSKTSYIDNTLLKNASINSFDIEKKNNKIRIPLWIKVLIYISVILLIYIIIKILLVFLADIYISVFF